MFTSAIWMYIDSYLLLLPILIIVGLLGGLSYVNTMFQILQSQTLEYSEKELAITLCTAASDIGILLAAITSLILN